MIWHKPSMESCPMLEELAIEPICEMIHHDLISHAVDAADTIVRTTRSQITDMQDIAKFVFSRSRRALPYDVTIGFTRFRKRHLDLSWITRPEFETIIGTRHAFNGGESVAVAEITFHLMTNQ